MAWRKLLFVLTMLFFGGFTGGIIYLPAAPISAQAPYEAHAYGGPCYWNGYEWVCPLP